MKTILKKFKLLLLFILVMPITVDAMVQPTNKFYINDYAEILSQETENYIYDHSAKLASTDGTQIVVVTVSNLEGDSIENYANQLFNEWGIGDKSKNNGLLLLLARKERMFRVEVGYGLEGILPDGKTGRFQDEYIIPYLKENKWNEGIKNGYDAFYKEIVTNKNLGLDYTSPPENASINTSFLIAIIGFILGITYYKIFEKNNIMYNIGCYGSAIAMFIFPFVTPPPIQVYSVFFCLGFLAGVQILKGFRSRSSSGWHSSGWHSSGGGSFGGGGHSGGGGSSRHF